MDRVHPAYFRRMKAHSSSDIAREDVVPPAGSLPLLEDDAATLNGTSHDKARHPNKQDEGKQRK